MSRSLAPHCRPVRRSARCLAALVALVVVFSNALAAMGVCIAKAPVAPVSAAVADAAPCPHAGGGTDSRADTTDPTVQAHCPQDEPGAQVRATDIPTTDLPPLAVLQSRAISLDPPCSLARAESIDESPPEPLYARLSRLLL